MDINLIIFASGSGSNAEQIVNHFANHPSIKVSAIFANKPEAYVLERAKNLGIPSEIFNREEFKSSEFLNHIEKYNAHMIVLAGFLWKIPQYMIDAFPDKIINIHPALLPKYGGKGMFGHFVHEAVIANNEKESGITIHFVNENYDEGEHLFQAKCSVEKNDTPDTLASRIHKLEHEHFPKVIEEYVITLYESNQ